ncbi:LOW QUALITY PROTEIN: hypothetical protein Cgig2_005233 [Carnegiea gigantea]|uniref:Uncharacterized protein n=1 Tax=Carnegiea gigantea TaxID=171969 RepID=A0A9Q1K3V1_9CARY|nr:LOW QUALITY PROTEIN: hypothetical protein Cgig2_005233 [Carnegiea gigantea]
MTLFLKSHGLSIYRVGCIVPYTPALTRRGDKLYFLGVTAFIFGPLTLIHVVEASLEIAVFLKFWGQRYQRGPASRVTPWLGPPFLLLWPHQPRPSQAFPLTGAASSFCRLHGRSDQPSAFPNTAGVDSHPRANASAVATSSSVTVGGSEASGVTKSQDLTRSWASENLAAESALMKLVDGHWGATAGSLGSGTYGFGRGGLFLKAGGAIPRQSASRLLRGRPSGSRFPHLRRGECRNLVWTTLSPLPLADR